VCPRRVVGLVLGLEGVFARGPQRVDVRSQDMPGAATPGCVSMSPTRAEPDDDPGERQSRRRI